MRPILVAILLTFAHYAAAQPVPGHHLPVGAPQPVRERHIDITRLELDLTFDMRRQTLAGTAGVSFLPLQNNLTFVDFDAADITVEAVEVGDGDSYRKLNYASVGRVLRVTAPAGLNADRETTMRIRYRAKPDTGMYFFADRDGRTAEAWNYGEGGRHYNWLPLYNDTNDRFAVDFEITVAKPYVVTANGTLQQTRENRDGTRTWHWAQQEPIPNYLLALNVGMFVEVPLRPAKLSQREVPLSVWTHAGDEASAAYSFADTPAMVEYFSTLLGYNYAWPKYDQITLRNFSGAMETTGMVGFTESSLHREGDMEDDEPNVELAFPIWTNADVISHELAHHWFGDLVTCRSLASIWINESFATFMQTVWAEHANGADYFTYQRWRYLHNYLDYIRDTGEVRPLEFFSYDSPNDMYTESITYIKGSLVLNLLRHTLGDEVFWRGINDYLHAHAFKQVDSQDLQRALEAASGRNLDWFFNDWIRGGAGYPALSVSHLWVPERKAVNLSIAQVQALLPFEDLFDVPIDVKVVTASGTTRHRLRLHDASLEAALPADSEPLMVVVDAGNWLIADIHQQQSLDELVYQLQHGELGDALRAARQLANDFPRDAAAIDALGGILADHKAFWGLRQEAAADLGAMGGEQALAALLASRADPDKHVRRAIAIGLGLVRGDEAANALVETIRTDAEEEVVGAAAIALGKTGAASARATLLELLQRDSRYFDVFRISALMGLSELKDASLAPVFSRYVETAFNPNVRDAAISGWLAAAPGDDALRRKLRELAHDADSEIREAALAGLGELHHAGDLEFLRNYAAAAADTNLSVVASRAADNIAAFVATR